MVKDYLLNSTTLLPAEQVNNVVNTALDFLLQHFNGLTTAKFYLQFPAAFEVTELFDSEPEILLLKEIPAMPSHPTPDGIEPRLFFGKCQGIAILVSQGHRHLCEGLGLIPCVLPLFCASKLGIKKHIFIDNAISLIPELKTGNWTMLTDFINGYSFSPLDGLHQLLEIPYPDLDKVLSQKLNSEIINAMFQVGIDFRLCTYQAFPGFHFCSSAEAIVAQKNGADIVGHDIVMEIILSYALGCQVSAAMLIGGQKLGNSQQSLTRKDILETNQFCSAEFIRGLANAIREIAENESQSQRDLPRLPDADADEILQKSITIKTNKKHNIKILR